MRVTKRCLGICLFVSIILIVLSNVVLAETGTIIASSVRIREDATTSSEVISVAKKDEEVEVIGEKNGWYQVKFENITGYISADYVKTNYTAESQSQEPTQEPEEPVQEPESKPEEPQTPQEPVQNETKPEINSTINLEKEISIKKLPNFSSTVISNIARGTEVTVIDNLNNWMKITDGNVTGWTLIENNNANVTPNSVEPTNPSTTDVPTEPTTPDNNISSSIKKGIVSTDNARVRKTPNGEILEVVDINDEVEILGEEGDWYKVNIKEYKGCYISKSLIKVQ